ncbi:hypothetical protein [Erythrobacter alti]|uniref:hypothetical protein n=1 Tax=Erythrobacter alti TaxID=1896145 RepID=UPI0030F3C690
MIRNLLLFFVALMAIWTPAAAQEPDDAHPLQGTWALQIDDASVFVFLLERNDRGNWRGAWLRPERFRGNGVVFSHFRGSEVVRTVDYTMHEDALELRFAPTSEEGSTDVLHFRATGTNQAELTYTGTDLAPFPLVRVVRGTPLGPFEDNRIYDRDNAVVEADYDPADEPALRQVVEEVEVAEEAPAPQEPAPQSRIDDDFLDGLDDLAPAPGAAPKREQDDASEADEPVTTIARACTDLDPDALPDAEELDALWGDDYEAIGSGLDIREYRMDNGDIARVTMLGERIYLNACGSAD